VKSKELFPPVFSRHALAYQLRLEDIMSRGESVGRIRALELVDARPGMRILDLACGPGNTTRTIAAAVPATVAPRQSAAALARLDGFRLVEEVELDLVVIARAHASQPGQTVLRVKLAGAFAEVA